MVTGRLFLALTIAVLPFASALAQQSERQPSKGHGEAPRQQRDEAKAKPCPEFGPGFVKIAGSDTCVKVGGSITVNGGVNGR